jgi:hypothetical protein
MDKREELGYSKRIMFKKIDFKGLNYKDLEKFDPHDLKRENLHSVYQTFDFLDLVKKWPAIVGPKLSLVTSPLKLKQDSLFIMAKHASYSHQLSFLAEEIKKEIFKVFPKLSPVIKKLVFQTQENYFENKSHSEKELQKPAKLHPQSPQYKILKAEADRLFGQLEDPELRELMTSIYIQSR